MAAFSRRKSCRIGQNYNKLLLKPTQENTVPRPVDGPPGDDDYELQQRRRLMSQWASMNQADRETYQARGSAAHLRRRRRDWRPPPGCFTAGHLQDPTSVMARAVNCIVPQPLEARDRAVFTKLRIMLYRLDGEEGPLIDDGHVSVCVPNPESDNAGCGLNPDREFLMWHYVENADFHFISMTSAGTVVFYSTGGPRVLVDRQALDTGRVLLCDFETNGQLEGSCRIRPYILYDFWPLIVGLGKTVRGVMDREVWKSPTFNGPYVPSPVPSLREPTDLGGLLTKPGSIWTS